MNANRCSGVTKSGAPCQSFADSSGFCAAHNPERAAHIAEVRRQGGLSKSNRARARRELIAAGAVTAEETLAVLGVAMNRLSSGKMESSVASALASLARAWFSGRQVLTLEELTARVAALEEDAA